MKLTDFLQDVGRPVAYYPKLRKITGNSTTAAILLCQFIYWRGKEKSADGWLYKTSLEIEEETGLSYKEQKTARKKLLEAGLMEEHYARLDHVLRFKLDLDTINEKWGNDDSDIREQPVGTLGNSPLVQSLNSTTETTTKNTDIDLPKLRKEAQERKTKQRANKKDTIDFLLAESRKIEPRVQMRMRVESALRGRKPDWDAPRSVWNGYDLVLMKREEETGETIERFMEWFYEDDFRATSDIYLQPKKINDWWSRAFTDETEMRPEYKKFVAEEIKSVPNPKA